MRTFEENKDPVTPRSGQANAPCIAADLNTLTRFAGTAYFPDLKSRVLFLEQRNALLADKELILRHLEQVGACNEVAALEFSKPEVCDEQDAPFSYADLVSCSFYSLWAL